MMGEESEVCSVNTDTLREVDFFLILYWEQVNFSSKHVPIVRSHAVLIALTSYAHLMTRIL